MAESNFNDPEQRERYRRELENLRNMPADQVPTKPDCRTRKSAGAAGWWWFGLVILILVCIWLVAWGGGRTTNTRAAVNERQSNPPNAGSPEVASVPQLISHPQRFAGRRVVVPRAVVEKRLSGQAVLVGATTNEGPSSGKDVTVVLPGNSPSGTLPEGTAVKISGTLTPVNGGRGNLGLNAVQSQDMQQQGFYLQAEVITPIATPR